MGNISFETMADCQLKLEEETMLPYKFDILDYTHLTHRELKEHIDRVGVPFYIRAC